MGAALVSGCGEEATSVSPEEPDPGCESPAEALPDGRCIQPGVPPDGCPEGFVHDGAHGCLAVLPEAPCGPGQMAIPGETTCRPVMA